MKADKLIKKYWKSRVKVTGIEFLANQRTNQVVDIKGRNHQCWI